MRSIPTQNSTWDHVEHFIKEGNEAIRSLAIQSKERNHNGIVPRAGNDAKRYDDMEDFLTWLDDLLDPLTPSKMTPKVKQVRNVPAHLQLIYDNPEIHFATNYQQQAVRLFNGFEAQYWGGSPPLEVDETGNATGNAGYEYPPPADHSVWGHGGIMDGIMIRVQPNGNYTQVFNTARLKRNANSYGHNGITVGAWFPFQSAAPRAGAHGQVRAGIHPGPQGAYSVVLSGLYHGLNEDNGNQIWYSGSGVKDYNDPDKVPDTAGNRAMRDSINSGQPVRVLRGKGCGLNGPTEGIRYDGLYDVVGEDTKVNGIGGKIVRFKLVRRGNQPARGNGPTAQELGFFNQIHNYYDPISR